MTNIYHNYYFHVNHNKFFKESKKRKWKFTKFSLSWYLRSFFIFLKLHRCNKIVVNKSFSHFIFFTRQKIWIFICYFPIVDKKEKEPKIALSDSFLFVSYYFTLTEGSCSALFLPYCILMFNQKMFYYFPLKMIISFQYIIFISSILLHRCNTRSVNDNNSQISMFHQPSDSIYIHSTDSILLIATFSLSFII